MIRVYFMLNMAFFSFCILVSCNEPRKQISLNLQDSIILQSNKPIPQVCLAMFYYEDENARFLFADDKPNKEIRLFDLDSNREMESIPIPDTGLNPIPYYFGFAVKSMDSIYLPVPEHKLYCINRKGEIVKRIDYSYLLKEYPLLTTPLSISRFTKGAVIKGNEIYFLLHDSRKYYFSGHPSDYHFLMKYTIGNDKVEVSPISLPDNFWKNGKREMSVMMTYNDMQNSFVFGTQFSDNIFISSDGTTITKTYHSKSDSEQEYYPYTPADSLSNQNYVYCLCKYSYNVGLLWDRKNKIYYRFVWPGMKDIEENQGSLVYETISNFPTFTIEILDLDFNILGSYPLPENKYNWNHHFLTDEGLFLAVNRSSDNTKTDKWVFHLFKVTR